MLVLNLNRADPNLASYEKQEKNLNVATLLTQLEEQVFSWLAFRTEKCNFQLLPMHVTRSSKLVWKFQAQQRLYHRTVRKILQTAPPKMSFFSFARQKCVNWLYIFAKVACTMFMTIIHQCHNCIQSLNSVGSETCQWIAIFLTKLWSENTVQ